MQENRGQRQLQGAMRHQPDQATQHLIAPFTVMSKLFPRIPWGTVSPKVYTRGYQTSLWVKQGRTTLTPFSVACVEWTAVTGYGKPALLTMIQSTLQSMLMPAAASTS